MKTVLGEIISFCLQALLRAVPLTRSDWIWRLFVFCALSLLAIEINLIFLMAARSF